jgi:twitching motility protein PilT
MELNDILGAALKLGASDVHLKAGLPPMFRIDGSLVPQKEAKRLAPEEITKMAYSVMSEYQKEKFRHNYELDLAYGVPGLGRFRVNVFQQRGTVGMVLRSIPFKILTIEQLMLPKILEKIAGEQRGLVLVTGTTGSGKSTTLAAMIDHINSTETCHIMTVEDPIEFLIRDRKSVVNQREVGVDTLSFGGALKSALRQDPDVILVGEMRDLETIETALTAAETGHLVLSTLHTLDATETINRIISAFPPHQQKQVRLQLGSVLRAVVSQRLVPRADGKGRVAAVEVMVCTSRVREMIEDKDRTKEIATAISQGHQSYGMQTFDQSLMSLLKHGHVTYEEALRQSTNPDDFALRVSGIASTSDSSWDDFEGGAQPTVPSSPPSNFAHAASQRSIPPTPMSSLAPGGRFAATAASVSTPAVSAPPVPRPAAPSASPPSTVAPRVQGATIPPGSMRSPVPSQQVPATRAPSSPGVRPVAPQTQKVAAIEPPSDDDFQIERF